jgi:hypothetical protein
MSIVPHNETPQGQPHCLNFDEAEAFATAFTAKQLAEAMAIFDEIRPRYETVREAFVQAIAKEIRNIGRELDP